MSWLAYACPACFSKAAKLEDLLVQGKKQLLVNNYDSAVDLLSDAAQLASELHGDFGAGAFEANFTYGQALLRWATEQSTIVRIAAGGSESDEEDEEEAAEESAGASADGKPEEKKASEQPEEKKASEKLEEKASEQPEEKKASEQPKDETNKPSNEASAAAPSTTDATPSASAADQDDDEDANEDDAANNDEMADYTSNAWQVFEVAKKISER